MATVRDAARASVFGGTSAVHRPRSLCWQAIRILWHQSSRAGFCPLCTPMLVCLRGSRLEPFTELTLRVLRLTGSEAQGPRPDVQESRVSERKNADAAIRLYAALGDSSVQFSRRFKAHTHKCKRKVVAIKSSYLKFDRESDNCDGRTPSPQQLS